VGSVLARLDQRQHPTWRHPSDHLDLARLRPGIFPGHRNTPRNRGIRGPSCTHRSSRDSSVSVPDLLRLDIASLPAENVVGGEFVGWIDRHPFPMVPEA